MGKRSTSELIDEEFDLYEGKENKVVLIDFFRFGEDHEAIDALVRQGRRYVFRFKSSEVNDLSDDDFKRLKVVLPHVEFASLLSSVDPESFSYIAVDNLEPVRSTAVQDRVLSVLKKESFISEVSEKMLKTPHVFLKWCEDVKRAGLAHFVYCDYTTTNRRCSRWLNKLEKINTKNSHSLAIEVGRKLANDPDPLNGTFETSSFA